MTRYCRPPIITSIRYRAQGGSLSGFCAPCWTLAKKKDGNEGVAPFRAKYPGNAFASTADGTGYAECDAPPAVLGFTRSTRLPLAQGKPFTFHFSPFTLVFPMCLPTRTLISILSLSFAVNTALAQDPTGDVSHGKTLFQQNCAVCHADTLGPGNTTIARQGPSLVGVFGRRSGAGPNFNYTKSLKESGFMWDASTLDRFLTNPSAMVPGTTMAMIVANSADRADVIGYLSSLKAPAEVATAEETPVPAFRNKGDPGDWRNAAPGVKHHITLADLPPPYSTQSAGNGPDVVRQPANAALSVPRGFTVRLFAAGLSNPRLMRVAPNGDIFIAETERNRIRVLRAADGAWAPSINQIFVEGLDRPFGIAFYPSNSSPEWIYIANNNSVIRFRYQNGDLKARDGGQVVVPRLSGSHGGHTTRDIAFSHDDRRLFISVGSGSNVGEGMGRKSNDAIHIEFLQTGPNLIGCIRK